MIAFAGLSKVVADFLKDQSWVNDAATAGTAQIVGMRGCWIRRDNKGNPTGISVTEKPVNVTDVYDDAIFVFGKKANGDPYSDIFRASVQPGASSLKKAYYKNKGCPTVQPGQYRYKRGPHNPPSGSYEAMRQLGQVVVIRDFDQNAVLGPEDRWDYPSTALNIHAGGTDPNHVGGWSEGCQVIFGGRKAGSSWARFHHLIYTVAKQQPVFHYTLTDGIFFGKWFDAKPEGRAKLRWLWFGSQGAPVRALQERLVALGHYHSGGVDGDFGMKTHQAVRRYEASEGLRETGVVTFELAGRLGL